MEIDLSEKFNKILKTFDFPKVVKIMQFLDWKWGMSRGQEVPNLDDMKEMCCTLFDCALERFTKEREGTSESSGGFEVAIYPDFTIELNFIPVACLYDSEMDLVY